ncbi:multi-sensor hybrid histidine kinase [Calothrix sp. NIES-4071]|nr:multi-sensor hybrid histidine kinase [Calothrix sp. NIES-4071]BAZ59161.1 multi-sensor hybrid histidine kinase [Calothrix sp. NIES-4105]
MSQQLPSINTCSSTQLLDLARFNAFFGGANAGLMILDCQLRYVYINQALVEINGLDIASHLGKSVFDVIPQLASLEPLLKDILHTAKPVYDYEISGETPQKPGILRYWSASYYPLVASDGAILGIGGIIIDISSRKKIELALKQSEERYLSLITATSQLVWTADAEGNVLNEASLVLGKYLETRKDDTSWLTALHPDDRESAAQTWMEAVKTKSLYQIEYRIKAIDSNFRYFQCRGVPILNEDGSVREWIGACTDIHDRKQAEDALRENNLLLRSILENTPGFVLVKDRQGRHIAVNLNLANFFGKPIEDIIGKDDTELLPPEVAREVMAKDQQIIATGIAETYEEEVTNGVDNATYLTTKAPWRDAHGNILGIIAITRDITERKQFEIALARAKQAAEAANYAKSEFLANMSHELRTPLNGILGYAQILQRSKNLHSDERSKIDVIYKCGSHLLTLINDILDLSKIEAQKVEIMPTDFHFPAFLQGVAEMCRIRAELKGIQFHYQIASELPIGVSADEKRLRQVLINLLSNAIKFTDVGSVTFTVSYATVEKIRFEVRDTGIGIAQENLQTIFQPFEQAGERRRQTEGTGLGLAISQKIVELMGSTIQVQSELGVGSIFWFDVNLPEALEWVKTSQTDDNGQIIGIKDAHPKLLIIDDKWENRSVLANLLSPIGFEVAEATNGEEGLHKVLEFQPDIIITDLLMPKLDGFGLIIQLRESQKFKYVKNIPIIVSSASVFETDRCRSLEVGGNDFLPKPIQAIDLFQTLRKHLNLTWIYEENTTQLQQKDDKKLVAPTTELEEFYSLAKLGNFKGIIRKAAALEQIDEKYIPFAKKMLQLSKEFQDQAILELIQSYK